MEKTKLELFQEALNEAWDNKIRREVESCTEEIITSERHKAAMQAILNGTYGKPKVWKLTKTRIAAILVAALLLLASCAVVYRNEIRNFVEEIYEDFIKVTYSNDETEGKTIEDVYELTYVPNGYTLEKSTISPIAANYEYINNENKLIVFEQRTLDKSIFSFDKENGYNLIVDITKHDVYYKTTKTYHYYIWNDGYYSMKIRSSDPISSEELMLIIDGIIEK